MDIENIVLATLLVSSNIYWAYVCHKLINKLMSKNYYEYAQGDSLKKDGGEKSAIDELQLNLMDDDGVRKAMEMNRLMGIA